MHELSNINKQQGCSAAFDSAMELHTSRGVFSGKPALFVSKGNRSGSFQCCLAKHLPKKLRLSLTGSYSLKNSRNSSLSIGRMGLPSRAVSRYRRSSDWLWGRGNPLEFSYSHKML